MFTHIERSDDISSLTAETLSKYNSVILIYLGKYEKKLKELDFEAILSKFNSKYRFIFPISKKMLGKLSIHSEILLSDEVLPLSDDGFVQIMSREKQKSLDIYSDQILLVKLMPEGSDPKDIANALVEALVTAIQESRPSLIKRVSTKIKMNPMLKFITAIAELYKTLI